MTSIATTAGTLTLISAPFRQDAYSALASRVGAGLKHQRGSYAMHICVPDASASWFRQILAQIAGKRESERYAIRSLFDTIQALQHPRRPVTVNIRQQLAEKLARRVEFTTSLDHLVADEAETAAARAYLDALDALGCKHPYAALGRTGFAASVREVFVADLDREPLAVQRWMLAQLRAGIDITACGTDVDELVAHVPEDCLVSRGDQECRPRSRPAPEPEWRCFHTAKEELEAILQACAEASVDLVVAANAGVRRRIEIACMTRGTPCQVDATTSVIHSIELRALIAYLDWLALESDAGLLTLLGLLGVSRSRWREIARSHRLPPRLTTACVVASERLAEDEDGFDAVRAVGELIVWSRFNSSMITRVAYFASRVVERIPGANAETLREIIGECAHVSSLEDLRGAIYGAIAGPPSIGPRIVTVGDGAEQLSERVWLSLATTAGSGGDEMVRRMRPSAHRRLVVSYQR